MNFLYIVGCIVFTVLGQVLVKKGVIELVAVNRWTDYALNPFVLAGLACAGLAAVSWIAALRHYDLSYAYPFMSLSFLLVAVLSIVIFGEHVKLNQWIGLAIVVAGLYVGSR